MVKIKPGESFVTVEPFIIATVLGSCVSACIRDVRRGPAGMNHFMLPDNGSGVMDSVTPSLRYGIHAMESLIGELIKTGSQRRDLEAKVFGGAAVVESISADVGAQNAEFVLEYLTAEGIRTTVSDLGGHNPRKVLFFVENGKALVKYLTRVTNDTITQRELEYRRTIERVSAPAVELF